MANAEQLERLKRSVDEWNLWRLQMAHSSPDLSGANLSGIDLSYTNLVSVNLSEAILIGAILTRAKLSWANLTKANLSEAILTGTKLFKANLSGTILTKANLSEGGLCSVNLSEADLTGTNLSEGDLRESGLFKTDLSEANLTKANLTGANLTRAYLFKANLNEANLTRAKLIGANLTRANLNEATLSNADLSSASVGWTSFGDLDLHTVTGLETIIHQGPSHLGINTLYRSHGNIPKAFVRGTGAPDIFIEYIHSLVAIPIEYHSLFLSHSHHDQAFTKRLYNDLQNSGVRCWYAPHDLPPGRPILRGIEEAIHLHEKLLLILSHHAVKSNWVQEEVEAALYKEVTTGQEILFPIRLDNTVLESNTGWAKRLRHRHIADFTNFHEQDSYQKALGALLRHLKVNKSPKQ